MGAGASAAGGDAALSFINENTSTTFDLSGADVNTPRGESAKAEVLRLRKMILDRQDKTVGALARARFEDFDKDKSGFLEQNELHDVAAWVMEHFGTNLGDDKDKVTKKILRRIDVNKDGKLDQDEFAKLFAMIVARHDLVRRAKIKFTELDVDKSGSLEGPELDAVVMWTLQAFPNDADVEIYKKHLLSHVDANADGRVDIDEFVVLFEDLLVRLELIERARAKFDELDVDKSGSKCSAPILPLFSDFLRPFLTIPQPHPRLLLLQASRPPRLTRWWTGCWPPTASAPTTSSRASRPRS